MNQNTSILTPKAPPFSKQRRDARVIQVGVGLLGTGVVSFLIRGHAPSATVRVFLFDGTITKLSGIVPNTVLHVVLASGFLFFALQERAAVKDSRTV